MRIVTLVLLLGAFVALSIWLGPWLDFQVKSNTRVFLVLMGLAFLSLAIAAIGAPLLLTLGLQLVRSWKKEARDQELAEYQFHARKTNVYLLSFCLFVLLSVLAMAANLFSEGAFSRYQHFGVKRISLFYGSPSEKQQLIKTLLEARTERDVNYAFLLLEEWRNAEMESSNTFSPEVNMALWGVFSRLVTYLNLANSELAGNGKGRAWQADLLLRLREDWEDSVIKMLERSKDGGSPEDMGDRARVMLGLLKFPGAETLLLKELQDERSWKSAVQGLMQLDTKGALFQMAEEIEKAKTGDDWALLALASSKLASAYHYARPHLNDGNQSKEDKSAYEALVDAWLEALQLGKPREAASCAAAVALQRLRHGRALRGLIIAFEEAEWGTACEAERVDLGLSQAEFLGSKGLLRQRLLDAIGILAGGNKEVFEWTKVQLDSVSDRPKDGSTQAIEPELLPFLEDLKGRIFE